MLRNCPVCSEEIVTGITKPLCTYSDYPNVVFHADCVENIGAHIASVIAATISKNPPISTMTIEALEQANTTLQIVAASILDRVSESILNGDKPYQRHMSMLLHLAKVGQFLGELVASSNITTQEN